MKIPCCVTYETFTLKVALLIAITKILRERMWDAHSLVLVGCIDSTPVRRKTPQQRFSWSWSTTSKQVLRS